MVQPLFADRIISTVLQGDGEVEGATVHKWADNTLESLTLSAIIRAAAPKIGKRRPAEEIFYVEPPT